MRLISVAHLQRSGGHAIIPWLMCHYDRSAFSNANYWRAPFHKVSMIWNTKSPVRDKDGMIRKSTHDIQAVDLQEFESPQPKDLMVVSYEGKNVADGWMPYYPRYLWGPYKRHDHVVVIRSVYNTLASKLKWRDKKVKQVAYSRSDMQLWIDHILLPMTASWCPIFFDEWFESPEARRLTEKDLCLPPNHDETIDMVNAIGFGSSFDRQGFNERACKMDVLNRWKQVEFPQEVLDNNRIRELNLQFFGWALDKQGQWFSDRSR